MMGIEKEFKCEDCRVLHSPENCPKKEFKSLSEHRIPRRPYAVGYNYPESKVKEFININRRNCNKKMYGNKC